MAVFCPRLGCIKNAAIRDARKESMVRAIQWRENLIEKIARLGILLVRFSNEGISSLKRMAGKSGWITAGKAATSRY